MLKSDRGRPVSEWRHVWTIEAGAAGGHPVLLIHAGRALWWYGQARKVTYNLIDDHDDRSERSEHDGTARPPSTAVPYIPVTQRGRPSDPIRFPSDPIPAQRSSGNVERMIERIVVYDRVHQHHQVERPGGEGRGEGEEKRSGSKGRGEARGGQRRARPWQSTTSTSCTRGGTSSTSECSSRIGEGQ